MSIIVFIHAFTCISLNTFIVKKIYITFVTGTLLSFMDRRVVRDRKVV